MVFLTSCRLVGTERFELSTYGLRVGILSSEENKKPL